MNLDAKLMAHTPFESIFEFEEVQTYPAPGETNLIINQKKETTKL
jgi:hypothetical protein